MLVDIALSLFRLQVAIIIPSFRAPLRTPGTMTIMCRLGLSVSSGNNQVIRARPNRASLDNADEFLFQSHGESIFFMKILYTCIFELK